MLNFSQNIRQIISASALTSAIFGFGLQDVQAASVGNQFNVRVNLQNSNSAAVAQPESAFCRSDDLPGAFGATVTVVCATGAIVDISAIGRGIPGAPRHGGATRHLLHVPAVGYIRGTVDGYIGVGTVLSWRQIKLNDVDYLEMLVGW